MSVTTLKWQCPFCSEVRDMHATPATPTFEDIDANFVRFHIDDLDVRAHLQEHETVTSNPGSSIEQDDITPSGAPHASTWPEVDPQ